MEKRQLRTVNGGATAQHPKMVNEESQTSESFPQPEVGVQEPDSPVRPVMLDDACQTSEALLKTTTKIKTNIAEKIRSSFHSSHRDSHSRPSTGHCPIFDKPFEATREDIKKQVELLMPKPQPYIVIGWFLRSASDPKERILEFEEPNRLFKVLKHGESDVRGWRRFFSLKSLQGFGLYKVNWHPHGCELFTY